MRRSGDVALRVVVLLGVWIVLGRTVGLLVGDTPDATIASAVVTTAVWFATAGAVALRDGRRGLPKPYPLWACVGVVSAVVCVTWQWAASAIAAGGTDVTLLRDDLLVLSPGLVVGAWGCSTVGLALGRHDAAARRRREATTTTPVPVRTPVFARSAFRRAVLSHRPLTASASRAIRDVRPPRESSRRSAAR